MLKKSFVIILIQFFGIICGLLSIYYIAGDMVPEVYSLVGINTLISGFVCTFSHLGIETTMMRGALYWIEKGENEKVLEYATQSILSRIIGFLVLAPFLITYLMFLDYYKYNSQYTLLLLSFYFGACINALVDSMTLIIRSKGGYVFAQFARTLNGSFMKFLSISIYFWLGAKACLYFYGFSSIPLLVLLLFKLNSIFGWKYVNIRATIKKIKESSLLWLRLYLDYFMNFSDSILVSVFFPASIMGAYSIYKNLETVAKSFIEGFFDVLSQNAIKFKGNYVALSKVEKHFNYARCGAILLIITAGVIFTVDPLKFVQLIHLSKYDAIIEIIYCVLFVSLLYLFGKYEINIISSLGSSKLYFSFGIITFLISIVSFIWVLVIPSIEGVLIQRTTIYLLTSIFAIVIFRRYKKILYNTIFN